MKETFDRRSAENYDKWYQTDFGRYVGSLEDKLIEDLLGETDGASVLDIGCGTGNHLKLFRSLGSDTVGVDPCPFMLEKAREKDDFNLILAKGEQLPIKDNSFDITVMITTLEFCENPEQVLREAARVTRKKMLVGVLNKWSLLAVLRRVKGWFGPSVYRRAGFMSICRLRKLLTKNINIESMKWQGVHFLPYSKLGPVRWLDGKLSFHRNPLASFLGVFITLGPKA